MLHVSMLLGAAAVALGSALVFPTQALAQATKVGVVTTLQGTATVARATAPDPSPLRFKDNIFVQDHIVTGDHSIIRILLGGKAVVTVRERSALTIHETATTATVALIEGKVAVAVAKERMKPGESVQVRSPNAIAGVRGTVVIAEVSAAHRTAPVTTRYTLLTGIVDVARLDSGQPTGPATVLHPLQTVTVIGDLPPGAVQSISRARAGAIARDYRVSLPPPPAEANAEVTERLIDQALQHEAELGGTGRLIMETPRTRMTTPTMTVATTKAKRIRPARRRPTRAVTTTRATKVTRVI